MRTRNRAEVMGLILLSGAVFGLRSPAAAPLTLNPEVNTTPVTAAATSASLAPLSFRPPVATCSVLPNRSNAGSRGSLAENVALIALVPDGLVYCAGDQPNLYFYQSADSKFPCIITITEPKVAKPLVVLQSPAGVPAGIHAIRLTKLNVKLKPDVAYLWSVTLRTDEENRSQDVIASGLVELKLPAPDFTAKLANSDPSQRPALYAQNGYWYDALQLVTDQIDHDGQNAALHTTRAALLKQVGLDGDKIESAAVALLDAQKKSTTVKP